MLIKVHQPQIIVFYAGDNDIAAGKPVAQVFNDFKIFADTVAHFLPNTKILYLPIKPSLSRWHFWDKMDKINQKIEKYCTENKMLTYVDIATPMLNENKTVNKHLFVEDGLHLNDAGYKLWSAVLRPYVKGLFSKK